MQNYEVCFQQQGDKISQWRDEVIILKIYNMYNLNEYI